MPAKSKTKPDSDATEEQDPVVDDSAAEETEAADPPASKAVKPKAKDLIAQSGGAANAVNILLEKITDQETQIARLTASAVPEGAAVLTGDALAAYEAYKKLGTPAKIAQSLAEGESRTNAAVRERDVYKASVIHGYDAGVLTMAIGANALEHGKNEKGAATAFVVMTDEKDATKTVKMPLPDWLKANQPKLLPSLGAAGGSPSTPPPAQFGGRDSSKEKRNSHVRLPAIF